jgi:hypothetical protein
MRQIHLAIVLFLLNTGLTVFWLWDARPRTVATMDVGTMDRAVHERLISALTEADIDPKMVRVCEVSPCTDGPAIFVAKGTLELALLPQMLVQEPGQAEVR